ncbi:MAG: AraC family transcriptional regulator [Opitutales bacterium]|nr:AraC family transcriptional regulator [Opitutales bacterium]
MLQTLTPFPIRIHRAAVHAIDRSWGDFTMIYSFWRIYGVDRLGASISLPTGDVPLEPENLYIIPAQLAFHPASMESISLTSVHFDVGNIADVSGSSVLQRIHILNVSQFPKETVSQITTCCEAGTRSIQAMQRLGGHMHLIMAEWFESLNESEKTAALQLRERSSRIGPAIELIQNNYARCISLDDIGATLHLSPDHTARLFREALGITPHRYLEHTRLRTAITLLLDSDASIDTIAEQTGFGNRHYFSRVFKKHYGHGPAKYRRRNRALI